MARAAHSFGGSEMTAHADPSSAGPPRSPIVGVVMLCVVVGVGGLLAFFALASPTPAAPDATATTTAVGSTTATDSTDVLIGGAAPGTALAALGTLDVKGRAPKTGYDRGQFGQQWADVDRNGCDTRNDILVRDLTAAQIKPGTRGCLVLSGTLADPYTATSLAFVRGASTSEALQVDHVVALSDAWQKGAQGWDEPTRTAFANDPLNLLAVDGPTNQAKGDGDAATWLPPNSAYRCDYVARQVSVKAKYRAWVTAAERTAIAGVLATCPNQATTSAADAQGQLAERQAAQVTADQQADQAAKQATTPAAPPSRPAETNPAPAPAATPAPATTPAPTPASPQFVSPGAFCSTVGARGVSAQGTPMMCSTTATDSRTRWRAAR
jgi:hypothetical protein